MKTAMLSLSLFVFSVGCAGTRTGMTGIGATTAGAGETRWETCFPGRAYSGQATARMTTMQEDGASLHEISQKVGGSRQEVRCALARAQSRESDDARTERRELRAGDLLRDPLERQAAMQNMRRQILLQTRDVPEERYQLRVRPGLVQHLVARGLDAGDAEQVLRDVDHSRVLRHVGSMTAPATTSARHDADADRETRRAGVARTTR